MKASELEFGWKGQEIEAAALWGARLILDTRGEQKYWRADLLGDRQSIKADNEDARAALIKALNGETGKDDGALSTFLTFLARGLKSYRVDPTSRVVFDRTFRGVRFRGSPNESHGYFYVTAALDRAGPTCDGCGTGGEFKGTKLFPGVCDRCRDELKADKRKDAKRRVLR